MEKRKHNCQATQNPFNAKPAITNNSWTVAQLPKPKDAWPTPWKASSQLRVPTMIVFSFQAVTRLPCNSHLHHFTVSHIPYIYTFLWNFQWRISKNTCSCNHCLNPIPSTGELESSRFSDGRIFRAIPLFSYRPIYIICVGYIYISPQLHLYYIPLVIPLDRWLFKSPSTISNPISNHIP